MEPYKTEQFFFVYNPLTQFYNFNGFITDYT